MALPFRIRRAEWIAGMLVIVIGALAVVVFMWAARGRGAFVTHHEHWVTMSEGYGIAPGGTVEMLGLEVGHVERVEISDDNRVQVHFAIDEQYARRLGEDSIARVKVSFGLQTMLGGAALAVTPGTPGTPELPDHTELRVIEPSRIADLLPLVGGDPMIADLEAIVTNTRALTHELASPDSELRQLLANANALMAALQRGEGTVGHLLKDDAKLFVELVSTLASVQATLKRVNGLLGKSGKLMSKSDTLIRKSDAMLTSSAELVTKADTVVVDAGTAFKKMDPVMIDAGDAMKTLSDAANSFDKTADELSVVLKKMDDLIGEFDDISRATKKVFPIRRHLDDKDKR